jgi:hypothetical protein
MKGMRERRLLIATLGYFLIILLIASFVLSGYIQIRPPSVEHPPTQISPFVLISANSNFASFSLIPIDHPSQQIDGLSQGVGFTLNLTSRITGSFKSTGGVDVLIYPHNASGYVYSSLYAGKPDYYTYSTGQVISGDVDVTLPPGTYDLVFVNLETALTNITITKNFVATVLS